MSKSNIVSKAFNFAYEAHANTFRKGTRFPYITHPINVMVILLRYNASEELLAAALLHDVVEDENVSFRELEEIFGEKVTYYVKQVSEPLELIDESRNRIETWRERKEHTISTLGKSDIEVKMLSCADKLSNLSDMLSEYEKIGERLWDKFNAPKASQEWYYNSLVEVFAQKPSSLSKLSLYQEFEEKVRKMFP